MYTKNKGNVNTKVLLLNVQALLTELLTQLATMVLIVSATGLSSGKGKGNYIILRLNIPVSVYAKIQNV